jgi:hypothetical protein
MGMKHLRKELTEKQRVELCMDQIQEILKEHGVIMTVEPQYTIVFRKKPEPTAPNQKPAIET